MSDFHELRESPLIKRNVSSRVKIATVMFVVFLVSSVATMATVLATDRDSVEVVPLKDWRAVEDGFIKLFGKSGVTVKEKYVEYRSGSYTHLRVSKDGRVSSHMPLHSLKAYEKDFQVEFNFRDRIVTILGKDINYTYKKP